MSMSRFRKEHSAWLQRHSRWDHGEVTEDPGPEPPTPTMDELDDALLKRFKIYRSKFFEGNEEVEVVNGFAEHQVIGASTFSHCVSGQPASCLPHRKSKTQLMKSKIRLTKIRLMMSKT